jgi:hypothetical protein
VIGLIVFFVLLSLLLAAVFLYYSYITSEIHMLPEEIAWSLKNYLT